MIKLEEKLWDYVLKKKHILFFCVVTLLGMAVRYCGRNFMSGDMEHYLVPWFYEIKANGGFASLSRQTGNYNLLYQTLICIMSYIDVNPVYQYKLLSIVFDFVLAISTALFVCDLKQEKPFSFTFNVAYLVVLLLPTVVLNSAYWGQCDSIYAAFLILTLLFLRRENYFRAFLCYGLAFGFKIQAIFILPFLICYYFYRKRFSILWFFLTVFVFWLTGIGGFLHGRSLLEPFSLYVGQAEFENFMWANFYSFWKLIGGNYDALKNFAIILTLSLCGLGLYAIISGKKELETREQYVNACAWFIWTCVLFLPGMHDRYAYVLDLLLIVLCFLNTKYIKYAFVTVVMSMLLCGHFLFKIGVMHSYLVIVVVAAWLHFTYTITAQEKNTNSLSREN